MKQPIPYSHLSLPEYAKMVGVNPIHFQGGVVKDLFEHMSGCSSIWRRHTWQAPDNVSHEDLAKQLVTAEETISEKLGFPIAPTWYVMDFAYPQWRRGLDFMRDARGRYRSIPLNIGKLINPGVRGTTHLGDYPVTYEDQDGDGYKETAVVTFDTQPDWSGLKLYFEGTEADPRWEIRPIRMIDKDAWKVEIDSWLMARPELLSAFPKNEPLKINLGLESNLVTTVDAYLEYNNQSVPTVTFMWNDGYVHDGYMEMVDNESGIVRPVPATFLYESEFTEIVKNDRCHSSEPDRVRLYFYAGKRSNENRLQRPGYETNSLDPLLAEAVAFLATARLSRDLCGCTNVIQFGKDMREDMALVSPQGNFLAVADKIQENPLGTRRGEWLAWNRLRHYPDSYVSVALV